MANVSPQKFKVTFLHLTGNPQNKSDGHSFPVEFHISRTSRDRYQFDQWLFAATGNVLIADFHAARLFAQKMNEQRDLLHHPETAVRAGDINAMGLIDEILHMVIQLYREEIKPGVLADALGWLENKVGKEALDKTLMKFLSEFPPVAVYRNEADIPTYLQGKTENVPNRQIALEEMLMLWLSNLNPAFHPFLELFDDLPLEKTTDYRKAIDQLKQFFDTQPPVGPENKNLIDLLREPAIKCPDSLSAQLEYIRKNWGVILKKIAERLGRRLLLALDLIAEEEKVRFHPAFGPAPTVVPEYVGLEEEPERFSPDLDWMPRTVLIAKSTLVWLDQLSKKYQRHIHRLDQIPDEELDRLAGWGFTGLWLIGVWQRSKASKKIKQLCGNPEAEASAYSLYDYAIAAELGGEEAYHNLRKRCWQRGIRLASDMVPNHMAIDSRWVMEHPDWFIHLDYPPFPAYTYNGPNLSGVPDVGIYIEDHYYERSDAAVTFKHVDFSSGRTRYIYHGNDGTSTPWNDTAQLNYLLAEVREAVIQTILHVARMFPIIRFDAAMTLAKKHFQRLWFPPPGSGGDIPSRAEHGMTREEFNRAFPAEFWREVVDRVAAEAPDTLLLAEAFWLMEGYFVRTLGMHRVYNSAFMNMLRDEENKKYRYTIKNTLEFDPEILKRYVNFMNNPDEDTAIDQFGEGDKYFGICTMMVTMPGLPMFGHGQVEGFHEKYGMEYRRAYYDEVENQYLIERHQQEIFPLVKKRYLFAGVENFLMYDFFTPNGDVDENVFAYSNRYGDERTVVVYNNRFGHTWGWISNSVAYAVKAGGGEKQLVQKDIGTGLDLPGDGSYYCIFSDQVSGLEYIRNCNDIHRNGLYLELKAYQYHVFLNFRIVQDNEWQHYAHLTAHLEGRGTHNIEEALMEVYLKPLHFSFRRLMSPEMVQRLMAERVNDESHAKLIEEIATVYMDFLSAAKKYEWDGSNEQALLKDFKNYLRAAFQLEHLPEKYPLPKSLNYKHAIEYLGTFNLTDNSTWLVIWSWLLTKDLGKLHSPDSYENRSRSLMDEWLLGKLIAHTFLKMGIEGQEAERHFQLLKLLVQHQNWFLLKTPKTNRAHHILSHLLNNADVQHFVGVNRYNGILWYNKESLETLLKWLFLIAALDAVGSERYPGEAAAKEIAQRFAIIKKWLKSGDDSQFQVEKLLEGAKARKRNPGKKK